MSFFNTIAAINNRVKSPSIPIETYPITTAITPEMTSNSSVYWFRPLLSADYPQFQLTKKYFAFWSTHHDAGNPPLGGIYWGEMDDLLNNGFIEKGLIINGNQHETPFLITIPNIESGISDDLFLYFHPDASHPDGQSMQQSRLITSSGGESPHLCTWEDKGRILGVAEGNTHTGYLRVYKRNVNDYISIHLTTGGSSPKFSTSVSTDGINWTRDKEYVLTQGLPSGSVLHDPHSICPFKYNNILYAMAIVKNASGVKELCVVTLGDDYHVSGFVKVIENTLDYTTIMLRVEGTVAYVYAQGGTNVNRFEPIYLFRWDLRNI
jgi:hypothetical protein